VILKIFSPKNLAEKLALWLKLLVVFAKIVIITLVFKKNAGFIAEKLGKITENCDNNIEPR
jgi:hypothetical protein